MTFNPRVWSPIAWLLSLLNLAGVWFAAHNAEPWHASLHAALGLLFGLWAARLTARR